MRAAIRLARGRGDRVSRNRPHAQLLGPETARLLHHFGDQSYRSASPAMRLSCRFWRDVTAPREPATTRARRSSKKRAANRPKEFLSMMVSRTGMKRLGCAATAGLLLLCSCTGSGDDGSALDPPASEVVTTGSVSSTTQLPPTTRRRCLRCPAIVNPSTRPPSSVFPSTTYRRGQQPPDSPTSTCSPVPRMSCQPWSSTLSASWSSSRTGSSSTRSAVSAGSSARRAH